MNVSQNRDKVPYSAQKSPLATQIESHGIVSGRQRGGPQQTEPDKDCKHDSEGPVPAATELKATARDLTETKCFVLCCNR